MKYKVKNKIYNNKFFKRFINNLKLWETYSYKNCKGITSMHNQKYQEDQNILIKSIILQEKFKQQLAN